MSPALPAVPAPRLPLILLLAAAPAAWSQPQPTITRIEAIENLEGVPFSHAGKGKEYLRLHVEGMPGPCLRVPQDFKLVDSTGKTTKAMSVSFSQPADAPPSSCDAFVATFSPSRRGLKPSALRYKDTEVDAAKVPVRTELYAAFVAGSIGFVVTPVDSGKSYDAVIRNLTDRPLQLHVAERTGGFIVQQPPMVLVLLSPPPLKDLDLPAKGEATLRFGGIYGRSRDPWVSGSVTLMPVPER